jgi:hypothetical protein
MEKGLVADDDVVVGDEHVERRIPGHCRESTVSYYATGSARTKERKKGGACLVYKWRGFQNLRMTFLSFCEPQYGST